MDQSNDVRQSVIFNRIKKEEGYAGKKGSSLVEFDSSLIPDDDNVRLALDSEGRAINNPKNMKWGESKYGAYFDSKGFLTTARGHLISTAPIGSDKFYKDINKHERKYKVADIMSTSKAEADKIYEKDFKEKEKSLSKLIDLKDLSQGTKDALLSEHFRGSIQKSPKTRKLINQGKYEEAASEFLDSDEYRNTESEGIINRFNAVYDALMNEATLKKEKQETEAFLNKSPVKEQFNIDEERGRRIKLEDIINQQKSFGGNY